MPDAKDIKDETLKNDIQPSSSLSSSRGELLFSENNGEWCTMPEWADYLLRFGYDLENNPSTRRIVLISMPCDSAAAGLIALGAMRKRLEIKGADDFATHFQRIENLTKNHDIRIGLIKHTEKRRNYRGPYVVDGLHSEGKIWVKLLTESLFYREIITAENASNWKFDGNPPAQALLGDHIPYEEHYAAMINKNSPINTDNLRHSDSGICIAGRVTGERHTHGIFSEIKIKINSYIVDLSQLLTVQDWLPGKISRITFFNTRTKEFDRNPGYPGLVVADGDLAFLRVLEKDDFRNTSVVGVIDRTIDRGKLESLGNKLADVHQWYEQDNGLQDTIKPTIKGLSILILKRI